MSDSEEEPTQLDLELGVDMALIRDLRNLVLEVGGIDNLRRLLDLMEELRKK